MKLSKITVEKLVEATRLRPMEFAMCCGKTRKQATTYGKRWLDSGYYIDGYRQELMSAGGKPIMAFGAKQIAKFPVFVRTWLEENLATGDVGYDPEEEF